MPEKQLAHIEAPTLEKILAACRKPRSYVTVAVRNDRTVRCRTEVRGNVASIDFDLIWLGSNFSKEAETRFVKKHGSYLKANIKRFKGTKSPFFSNFGATSIHFHVLESDAGQWFDDIYSALRNPANFTAIESPFERLKTITRPGKISKQKKPVGSKKPSTEPPEIATLRDELSKLQRPERPRTPETIKKIQRVLKTYERPSAITRYVKRCRGSACQLCGYKGFRTRKGTLYCEVHHLFHLSKNPPADCLRPEYLVVLCATCHRRMHYARVGEPTGVDTGWSVSVDGEDVLFVVEEG
jgi:5-methylcytosine-specific restriction endonuclease McrA